jgi:3-oxoacyl-[acyl-carrier-protein] synthase II
MMEARSCLDRSIAKLMVTGVAGTRINTTRLNYRGDLPLPEVSDPVSLSSRPHDQASVGVVGGEAAVSFVIESSEQAAARGAKPLAKIAAMVARFVASPAMVNQPKRSTESSVDAGRGSAKAIEASIRGALQEAGINADEIGAVISQACGDPSIDQAEAQAIQTCLPSVPVTAPIASLGHTGAAAGAVNIAIGTLVIEHQQIPPTIGLDLTSRGVRLVTESQPLRKNAVLCLSHTSEGSAIASVLVSG